MTSAIKARAALARGPHQPLDIVEAELRAPRDREVLVRVVAAGICHTDLIIRDGWFPTPMPAVLGHEGAGVVEAIGSNVTGVSVGDHVVMTFNFCEACAMCTTGHPAYCSDFWTHNFSGAMPDGSQPVSVDGTGVGSNFFGQSSFAQYALAHERNIVAIAPEYPLELVGPLGCGIQTGAGAVLNTLRPSAGSSIAVFGAGAVGLSAVMAAKLSGATSVIVIDRHTARLQLAEDLGATATFDAADRTTAHAIRKLTGGGVEYAVEATGVPDVLRVAMDSLAQGGTCALIGAARNKAEATIDISTLLFGRKLVGVIEGDSVPRVFIPRLLELYRQGSFPFDRLITRVPFSEINAAIEGAESGRLVKPVVVL